MKSLLMKSLLSMIILLAIFFASPAFPATYWVSPTGAATSWAACQSDTPLSGAAACPLSRAFSSATAGDQVWLRAGTYSAPAYTTANAGTSGAKITLQAYTGETVNFTGAVDITINKSYWVLNGIRFSVLTSNSSSESLKISGCSYCEIRNCLFDANNNALYGGFFAIGGGGHHTVDSCTFQHLGAGCPSPYADGNLDALSIGYGIPTNSTYNTISNCTFQDINSYNIVIYGGSYNQILNNSFNNSANTGLGISLFGNNGSSNYNLIDGNTFVSFGSCMPNPANSKSMLQVWSNNNSFRRNIFYNTGTATTSLVVETDVISHVAQNNYFYNNTMYNTYYQAINLGNANVNNNKFYNNIFWNNHTQGPSDVDGYVQGASVSIAGHSTGWNNTFDHNFIQYGSSTSHVIYQDLDRTGTLSQVQGYYPTLWTNNITNAAGPGFVNAGAGNFNLAVGSVCIDAGVVVNDTNAATGGWSQLTYSGSGPDIGAFEYGLVGSAPAAPQNLRIIN